LKQGDALSSSFLNFALEYTIRKVQGNQFRLELDVNINLFGDNVNNIQENMETFWKASMDFGLEINLDKKKST
jgi:hypothetical protein